MYNPFTYPRWGNIPGKRHATIYVSDKTADVVTYGVRVVNKKQLPIVKFTGFEEAESAGALEMQRLGEAMKAVINHAARSCRLPVNHSGKPQPHKKREEELDGQKYIILELPIYLRISADRQQYIAIRIWKGGEAAHSAVITCPPLVFWDIPTMAQFEATCFRAAELARSQRP